MTALFAGASRGAGLLVIALVTLIGVFLLAQAIPALLKDQANFLTSREWAPGGDTPRFGIVELLWTTVIVVGDRDGHRGAVRRRRRPVHHAVRAELAAAAGG